MTVKMIRIDDGKAGDIHPNEVGHMLAHGWTLVAVESDDDESEDDCALTDDELRAAIKAATGKAPHHKTGRAKLIEAYEATKAEKEA